MAARRRARAKLKTDLPVPPYTERRARLARAIELLDQAMSLLGETGTRWGVGTDLEAARKALNGLGAASAGGTGGGT